MNKTKRTFTVLNPKSGLVLTPSTSEVANPVGLTEITQRPGRLHSDTTISIDLNPTEYNVQLPPNHLERPAQVRYMEV
jgi:hypothetical protein